MSAGLPAVGAWLFRQRGWTPIPLLVAALVLGRPTVPGWAVGLALVLAGQVLRLWAVGHIGPGSRTRGDGAWAVVQSGPYAWVRNPLYLGNGLLWTGVGAVCGPTWAAALLGLALVQYPAIVAWEEQNLLRSLGQPYLAYLERVPRWWPRRPEATGARPWHGPTAWRSERSTLLALAAVLGALAVRTVLFPGD